MTVLKPSFEEFSALAASGNLIPVWTELAADYETPVSVFQKLSEGQHTPSCLLESAENSEQIGRYHRRGLRPCQAYGFAREAKAARRAEHGTQRWPTI